MSILASIGLFFAVVVCVFAGTMLGGAMRFGRFGSSGPAILGSGGSFALFVTLAVAGGGSIVSWVFAALAAFVFGIIMRGAAS